MKSAVSFAGNLVLEELDLVPATLISPFEVGQLQRSEFSMATRKKSRTRKSRTKEA